MPAESEQACGFLRKPEDISFAPPVEQRGIKGQGDKGRGGRGIGGGVVAGGDGGRARRCGRTWRDTWRIAGLYDLLAVMIDTWNDFGEGTDFEFGIGECVYLPVVVTAK